MLSKARFYILLVVIQCVPLGLIGKQLAAAQQVDVLGVAQGLSHSSVNVVIQDSYGLLWVGTHDGLNKYDGYEFRNFRNDPLDTTSIISNYITSILEDKNGNLWVGTKRGLSVLNRTTGEFHSFTHNPSDANSLSDNSITSIYEDSEEVIWVKTIGALDRFSHATNSFVRYPHFSEPFTSAEAASHTLITEDSQNGLWVGSKDGFFFFDTSLGLFKRYAHNSLDLSSLSHSSIVGILPDTSSNIWVVTRNGLNYYRSDEDTFDRFILNDRKGNSLLRTVFLSRQGNVLVGTNKGLYSFLVDKDKTFEYLSLYSNGKQLKDVVVNTILEDRTGIIWLGTQHGLMKWDRTPPKFNLYAQYPNQKNLFGNNDITAVLEHKGEVWVGTNGRGLFVLNRATNSVQGYSSDKKGRYNIGSNHIESIYRSSSGSVFLGTRSGLYLYSERLQRFTKYFSSTSNAYSYLNDNPIRAVVEDSLGNIWLGTQLGLFIVSETSLEPFSLKPNQGRGIGVNVNALAVDSQRNVWVATNSGLFCIETDLTTVHSFSGHKPFKYNQLISDDVLSLHTHTDGGIWLGTESGLHHFCTDEEVFSLYTERDGLPNNIVYSIQEDSQGNIWLATNQGIAQWNIHEHQFYRYTPSDGLQGYVFNLGSSHSAKDGELFFGGRKGLNSFYPDSIRINTVVPDIVITSFEVFTPEGSKYIPILGGGKNEVVIKDFSLINLEFAAMDFTNPSRNQFKYKMEGLDDKWIDLGTRRFATFSHLNEGVYTFRVVGSNNDNIWNNQGTTLSIVVKANFWETRVARITYVVLVILFIFFFLRARTRILRRTNRLLKEREVAMTEVQAQKEELIVKNKSITDSITYAKRIQEAIMPNEVHFKKIVPDSFILYMPKDIVSGDFYWVNETEDRIFVAVIDCTGHGVPGAFMSIIGVELLRNIINVQGINDAAEILNKLNDGVNDVFGNGEEQDSMTSVKDGMDVSFCIFDKHSSTLQYSGAFTTLYIVRDSKILEVKGDRVSVGMGGQEGLEPIFKSHSMDIQPNDMVYMFTDGYADQFGGAEGKKYKFRRFRHLLLNIHKFPVDSQRKFLYDSIIDWKGAHEQVDDILIIGIKSNV